MSRRRPKRCLPAAGGDKGGWAFLAGGFTLGLEGRSENGE